MSNELGGHLSYKTTFSLFQKWPFNTGLTIYLAHLAKYLFFLARHSQNRSKMRTVIEDISCITMVIFYDGEYSYYIIFRIYFCLFLVSLLPVLLIIRTLLIFYIIYRYHNFTVVYPIRNGHFKMADCKSSKR